MTTRPRILKPSRAWACLLLMWSVLAGVVAMHGLGSGAFAAAAHTAQPSPHTAEAPAPHSAQPPSHAAPPPSAGRPGHGLRAWHAAPAHGTHRAPAADTDTGATDRSGAHRSGTEAHGSAGTARVSACHHAGLGDGPEHPHHADATCAAPGISTGPLPPSLLPGATAAPADGAGLAPAAAAGPDGRSPPSLSQLQLLRI
ncbi:DUF6153 family protein [Streptomyces sp. NPDC018031]|uniref:DUF6153 family protein n=1 Tax=Streptomyces sp. NPDC018031 TaxID=3365033 RepID=UPI003795362B